MPDYSILPVALCDDSGAGDPFAFSIERLADGSFYDFPAIDGPAPAPAPGNLSGDGTFKASAWSAPLKPMESMGLSVGPRWTGAWRATLASFTPVVGAPAGTAPQFPDGDYRIWYHNLNDNSYPRTLAGISVIGGKFASSGVLPPDALDLVGDRATGATIRNMIQHIWMFHGSIDAGVPGRNAFTPPTVTIRSGSTPAGVVVVRTPAGRAVNATLDP